MAMVGALLACGDGILAPDGLSNDPAGAVFVTSDIVHFWEAYDAGGKDDQATPFQTLYLDRASPGLRDFMVARNVTAASLRQIVSAAPDYFAAIKGNMLRLADDPAVLTEIRENYDAIEAIYPQAVYPPVTFLVGSRRPAPFATAGCSSAPNSSPSTRRRRSTS